ncbi:YbjN domain-containing protein [Pelagibius sp. Alg239-R121]|uniref:YbjN domain-containing protein n=1 Tax=Pelagibius sp. Alg239-R121 TaxID=2993448 RepID=UPI0024A6BA4F|nr:YbjN domain-containing protein [Pelagibius sp. Alg239-R121]
MDTHTTVIGSSHNPLDILEELVIANDWSFDRHNDSELTVEVAGRWCDYHMYFVWQHEVSAVIFTCQFDLRVPDTKRSAVYELIGSVNEKLWLGHFDLLSDDGTAMFRHTVPLRGLQAASVEQLEDLVDTAVVECERFYPAIQMVVWGGQSVQNALAAALMETVGEA